MNHVSTGHFHIYISILIIFVLHYSNLCFQTESNTKTLLMISRFLDLTRVCEDIL